MKVISSTATFFFSPVQNIREKVFELENLLQNDYPKPFNLITLPDVAPSEFPRITATSHHGFSSLAISTNSIQFTTRFNLDFCDKWEEKCKPYLMEHIDRLFIATKNIFSNMFFCGLTINTLENGYSSSTATIVENQIKHTFIKNATPYDIEMKQAVVHDKKYYINIKIQNLRVLPGTNVLGKSLKDIEKHDTIGITLDINDRYAANYQKNYKSSTDVFWGIFKLANTIICSKLNLLYTKGEFTL
ncbi:MAG: hypothetical protein BKP49_07780 [Treponema sp. CETP13]|nr:MAG: hypothetical protein BKP49_07780 [Treponema sp. CETP13]